MEKRTDEVELKVAGAETKEMAKAGKPRRRLNPVAKWILIGVAAAGVTSVVIYAVVNGKKVPVKAVEKAAETVGEVAAAI